MKTSDARTLPASRGSSLTVGIGLLVALLTCGAIALHSVRPRFSSSRTESGVEALELKCFAQMQNGQIDRTQLTPDYSAQLTDTAVQGMSRYLREYKYGVTPTGAEVVQTHKNGGQTLYVVKLLFPRGDAASLLFGINARNQITGISLLGMAGD